MTEHTHMLGKRVRSLHVAFKTLQYWPQISSAAFSLHPDLTFNAVTASHTWLFKFK